MPAKWQQWMPLQIDRWRGSPAVRAMHPAARSGYLDLLIAQWQTDDCALPADAMSLAELSGLGDEMWALYSERILRNFWAIEGGKIQNQVCFEEWQEAKRVFDSRSAGAKRTNTARSQDGNRPVTEQSASGERAVTGTQGQGQGQGHIQKEVNTPPSAGASGEFIAATHLQQSLGIPASAGDIQVLAQVVMFEAKNRGDTEKATDWLIEQGRQAQQRGEVVNVWWFKDKKYTEGQGGNRQAKTAGNYEAARRADAALAARYTDGPS